MASSDIDGGWAWMIVVATFFMTFLTMGLPWAASGAYNVLFMRAFPEASAASVAWATSLTSAVSYAAGPLGSFMVTRYGLRLPTLVGGVMATAGYIVSMFAPGINFLIFSFGILTGLGLGIAHIPGASGVPHYFQKYLGIATGIGFCGAGVGTFVTAPLVTALDEAYGWRGSLLIVGGLSLNILVCGFIFRSNTRIELRTDTKSAFDPGLFKVCGYVVVLLNGVCVSFGICIVFVHLLAFAELSGYSDSESAMLMSAIGLANLCGRLSLPCLTSLRGVNTVILFSVCFILSGVSALLYPFFSHNYAVLVILSAGFGFFTASYGCVLNLVLVEIVGANRFANAYGYLLIFMAVGHTCGGPTAGFLYDSTGTYNVSLHMGGAVILFGGCLSLIILCVRKSPSGPEEFTIEDLKEDSKLTT